MNNFEEKIREILYNALTEKLHEYMQKDIEELKQKVEARAVDYIKQFAFDLAKTMIIDAKWDEVKITFKRPK